MILYKEKINDISVMTVLDIRRPSKNGLYYVKIQVGYRGKQKYFTTGKELSTEDWEKLPSTRMAELLKTRNSLKVSFDLIFQNVYDLVERGEFSLDRLIASLKHESGLTLNEAFQIKINELKAEGRIGTMMYYKDCLVLLEKFDGKTIPFEKVTIEWLKKFEMFMLNREMAYATIGMRMRAIRAMMNVAKKEGHIKDVHYPFGRDKYEIKTGESKKKALTIDQISKIVNYPAKHKGIRRYRDIWFFMYLCNGINTKDLVRLKFKNIIDGEICFIREKTKRTAKVVKHISVPLTPLMKQIIDRWGNESAPDNYIFPLIHHYKDPIKYMKEVADVNKRINKNMKFIGAVLGIGNITTYTARHSFATVLKRSGANISYISESLGHSDLKTTESYLASFEKEEREKNAALLTKFLQIDE